VEPTASAPTAARRSRTSDIFSARLASALILAMMSRGVPAGATIATQFEAAKPGTPDSATVGQSGPSAIRRSAVTAMAFTRPDLMCTMAEEAATSPTGTTPLDRLRARPGKRTIRLQMMGFEPWETTVQLEAGASESISAALEPRTAPPPPEPITPKITEGDLVERGPDVVDPKCIDCPGVPYPERARRDKLEGSVQVSFIVNESGAVEDIIVEASGGEVFDREVIEKLQSWRHEPATKNGVRVKVRLQKRFTFRRGN